VPRAPVTTPSAENLQRGRHEHLHHPTKHTTHIVPSASVWGACDAGGSS
jgi:hypothetical protein